MTLLLLIGMVDEPDIRDVTPRVSTGAEVAPTAEEAVRVSNPMLAHVGRMMVRMIPFLLMVQ